MEARRRRDTGDTGGDEAEARAGGRRQRGKAEEGGNEAEAGARPRREGDEATKQMQGGDAEGNDVGKGKRRMQGGDVGGNEVEKAEGGCREDRRARHKRGWRQEARRCELNDGRLASSMRERLATGGDVSSATGGDVEAQVVVEATRQRRELEARGDEARLRREGNEAES